MQLEVADREARGVEGADDVREHLGAAAEPDRPAPGGAAVAVPKRVSTSATRARSPGSLGTSSSVGRPISAFSASGVPVATMARDR